MTNVVSIWSFVSLIFVVVVATWVFFYERRKRDMVVIEKMTDRITFLENRRFPWRRRSRHSFLRV